MKKHKSISDKEEKIKRSEVEKVEFKYIKFNLSFISSSNEYCFYNKCLDATDKEQLLNRLHELSQEPLIMVLSRTKERGFESMKKSSFEKDIDYDSRFGSEPFRKKHETPDSKFFIFRLYTNSRPKNARIIGKLINNVFYILYIDEKGQMYSH